MHSLPSLKKPPFFNLYIFYQPSQVMPRIFGFVYVGGNFSFDVWMSMNGFGHNLVNWNPANTIGYNFQTEHFPYNQIGSNTRSIVNS